MTKRPSSLPGTALPGPPHRHLWLAQTGLVLLLLMAWLLPSTANAQSRFTSRQAAAAGVETWSTPFPEAGVEASRVSDTPDSHGWLILTSDWQHRSRPISVHAELNTETIRLAIHRIPLGPAGLWIGARIAGEAFFAGLLPDYWVKGEYRAENGFYASYVSAEPVLGWDAGRQHYLEFSVTGRRWFFRPTAQTSDTLVLPDVQWVAEPRFRYTWWGIQEDISLWQRQRLFRRVRGAALGVDVGADFRDRTTPWGALRINTDADAAPETPERLNQPGSAILRARLWAAAGHTFHRRFRLQWRADAGVGHREDDLTRQRIGGMNPWVAPISGQPWASNITGNFATTRVSAHIRLRREHEVGATFDIGGVDDALRTGDSAPAVLWGTSVFADLRGEHWQLDIQIGFGPSQVDGNLQLSTLLGFGWGF
jgi:hypothetical protein